MKDWARAIKRDVSALWLAARDPHTPWYAKGMAAAVAAYALSPIDLIPDFIPILGYLDDLVIVLLGVILCVRLIPAALMDEIRQAAAGMGRHSSIAGLVANVAIWAASAALAAWWLWPWLTARLYCHLAPALRSSCATSTRLPMASRPSSPRSAVA